MAEYIEREAIEKFIEDGLNTPDMAKRFGHDAIEIMAEVHYMPAADVATVVHGRWEFLGPNRLIGECMCGTCSVCKVRSKYIVNTMLCPNCGAKMDEGETMRMIDADAAAAFAENCGATFVAKRLRDSKTFPDVVVRCKDCKYHDEGEGYIYCWALHTKCPDDSEFFCKYGKRKEAKY